MPLGRIIITSWLHPKRRPFQSSSSVHLQFILVQVLILNLHSADKYRVVWECVCGRQSLVIRLWPVISFLMFIPSSSTLNVSGGNRWGQGGVVIDLSACLPACLPACLSPSVSVCVRMHVLVCMHVCVCTCQCVYVCRCACICLCVCVCVCMWADGWVDGWVGGWVWECVYVVGGEKKLFGKLGNLFYFQFLLSL